MEKDKQLVESLETPFGKFEIFNDGTFIDFHESLQWVRAPWGMRFEKQAFTGEPIKIDWYRATKLFGIGSQLDSSSSALRGTKLLASKEDQNFQRGDCVVNFAGHTDWRLPTGFELDRIGFYNDGFPGGKTVGPEFEGFEYSEAKGSDKLRETLFPNLHELTGNHLWSANAVHDLMAWSTDFRWPLTDEPKTMLKYVLVVRKINDFAQQNL